MGITEEVYNLLGLFPESENDSNWFGGICRFSNVPYENISRIADILGDDFLNENQNFSPTTRDFLEVLAPYSSETTFSGYVVSSTRPDERVTLESVVTVFNEDTVNFLRNADSFKITGEEVYAWWD